MQHHEMLQGAERVVLVVSRHWHSPEIKVAVCSKQISIELGIADMAEALLQEMGSPWRFWTKAKMRVVVMKAINDIIEKQKEASTRAMT